MSTPTTLFDKVWRAHEVHRSESGQSLLWIDRHFVHEGSFHAFNKLAERQLPVARPDLTFGIADHYVPTLTRDLAGVADPKARGNQLIGIHVSRGKGNAKGV